MSKGYKPAEYTSLSPYLIVNGAQKMIDLLQTVFGALPMRRYNLPDGHIMHAEVKIDDSILMLADASDAYPPNKLLLHVYVKDVDDVFRKAVAAGCKPEEAPKEREGDPDRRGSFLDFAGNTWSIATQRDV